MVFARLIVKKTLAERFHGHPCPWCKREMDRDDFHLQPTRDHYPVPRSKGGGKTVIACLICNNIKGDRNADEWLAYMALNPEWWKQTRNERTARRSEQRRRAKLRQPEKPSTPMADSLMVLARKISEGFDDKFGGS